MISRTSGNWISKSNTFDYLKLDVLFESKGKYGIPCLLPEENVVVEKVVDYKVARSRTLQFEGKAAVHFFLDDYVFNGVWVNPERVLNFIKKYGTAFSPDFSLYTDMPTVLQIFNVYRNRWVGRYWQENGIHVLPSVSWSDKNSFDFCFTGIPNKSAVALSALGIRSKEASDNFIAGFYAMLESIQPKHVYWVGEKMPLDIDSIVPNTRFPSYWELRRENMK